MAAGKGMDIAELACLVKGKRLFFEYTIAGWKLRIWSMVIIPNLQIALVESGDGDFHSSPGT